MLSQPFAVTATAVAVANVDAIGLIRSVRRSSTCAPNSEGSVRKSSSFSAPAYRPHRLGLLLQRTLTKIDAFVTSGTGSRRRAVPREGARAWRPELVTAEPLKWSDKGADNSPWIKALAELRHRATREGWCYQHVQAIAVDQYAETALYNRDYRPLSFGSLAHVFYFELQRHAKYGAEIIADLYCQSPHL